MEGGDWTAVALHTDEGCSVAAQKHQGHPEGPGARHSPGLPAALGRSEGGGRFGGTGLHAGLLAGHGQHLPLLLGQFGGNGRVLDAGAATADGQRRQTAE